MADDIARCHKEGHAVLEKLEQWLAPRTWLVGERYTLADLAASCYVSLAGQGGYDMARYPAIRAWLGASPRSPAGCRCCPASRPRASGGGAAAQQRLATVATRRPWKRATSRCSASGTRVSCFETCVAP